MAEVDPNVILEAKPPPPFNPLGVQQQVVGLQNAQAQNQLLQNANQEFQQKQAAGQIVSNALMQHTTPAGGVDYNAVRADLASQGAGNPYIGDALTQNLAQQGGQIANDTASQGLSQQQVQTYRAHLGVMADALAPLVNKPNLSISDITHAAAGVIGNPDLAPDHNIAGDAATLIANLPENATSDQLRTALKGVQLQVASAQDHLNAAYGTPTPVNNGAGTSFQDVNPYSGTVAPMSGPAGSPAFIPNQLSPAEKASRTTYVDPQGVTHSVPLAALVDSEGNPTAAGRDLTTSMAPGAAENLAANTARVQQIQHQAATAPTRLSAMQDVHAVIDNAPATAFGPTSDLTSRVGKLAAAFGVSSPNAINGQASIEELNKSLTLIASQQAAELGAGTDASRAMVHDSNPSLANSKAGLERNLAVVQGNEMYGVAKNRALQTALSNGMQPSQVPQFETAFNKVMTPLVFQTHFMDPQGQKEVFNSLSGSQNKDGSYSGEKGAFLNALDKADRYGWFSGQ